MNTTMRLSTVDAPVRTPTARRNAGSETAPAVARLPRRSLRPFVKPLAIAAVFAAVIGAITWRFLLTPAVGPAELTLLGNIDVRQVNLSFKVGGRIAELLVDEGDAVTAGQPIAKLDEAYFLDDLRVAQARRDTAAANLERLENGFRKEEIEQARALESQRQATLNRAEQDYRRMERLHNSMAISDQEFDRAVAALSEAKAALRSATASRALYEAGARAEDIAAARAQLATEEAQVVESERRLADRTIYAPNNGVILTRAREKGAIVNPGETVFTLTLTSPVWVRTYVGEPDLGTVEPGMNVRVLTDTPHGKNYVGHVGYVSPTAEFTPKTVETRELRTDLVYRVRIVIDDADGVLRQGMPVTVIVPLEQGRERTFWHRLGEALFLDQLGIVSTEY